MSEPSTEGTADIYAAPPSELARTDGEEYQRQLEAYEQAVADLAHNIVNEIDATMVEIPGFKEVAVRKVLDGDAASGVKIPLPGTGQELIYEAKKIVHTGRDQGGEYEREVRSRRIIIQGESGFTDLNVDDFRQVRPDNTVFWKRGSLKYNFRDPDDYHNSSLFEGGEQASKAAEAIRATLANLKPQTSNQ